MGEKPEKLEFLCCISCILPMLMICNDHPFVCRFTLFIVMDREDKRTILDIWQECNSAERSLCRQDFATCD